MLNAMFRKPRGAAIALATFTALALAGCSGGGNSTDDVPQTLTVWWYETDDSALAQSWNNSLETFKKEHPDVTVKFELKTFEEMQQSGQKLLSSNEVPDVVEYNKGNATAGVAAEAGLLTDMTKEAAERGWDLDNTAQDVGLYDKGVMGSGQRYGVTNYGEFVTVWYNTELFAEHGVEVPATLPEFETALKTFTDNGVTPLALGSNDYFGSHLLYELALANMDETSWAAYQQFAEEPDWAAWEKAADKVKDWTDKGYIAPESNDLTAQEAGDGFIGGDFPMMVSGSWWAGNLDILIAEGTVQQFLFPGNSLHPGSGGNLWVVPQKAKNKDLAYDFIDITLRPEAQNMLGRLGSVPVAGDPKQLEQGTAKIVVGQFNELVASQEGGLAWYPDWPVAGLHEVQVAQMSELVRGTVTPEQAVENIKAAYINGNNS